MVTNSKYNLLSPGNPDNPGQKKLKCKHFRLNHNTPNIILIFHGRIVLEGWQRILLDLSFDHATKSACAPKLKQKHKQTNKTP